MLGTRCLIAFVFVVSILLFSCGPSINDASSSQKSFHLKLTQYLLDEQGRVVSGPFVVTRRISHLPCFGAVIVKEEDKGYVYLGKPAPVSSVLQLYPYFQANPFKVVGKAQISEGKLTLEPDAKPFCAAWLDSQNGNELTGIEVVFTSFSDTMGIFYATQGGPGVLLRQDGFSDYSYAMVEFNVADGVVSLLGTQMAGRGKTGKGFRAGQKFSLLVEVFDGVVRVFSEGKLVALFIGPGLNTTHAHQGMCFGIFSFGKLTIEKFCVYSYDGEPAPNLTEEYVLSTSSLPSLELFYEGGFSRHPYLW